MFRKEVHWLALTYRAFVCFLAMWAFLIGGFLALWALLVPTHVGQCQACELGQIDSSTCNWVPLSRLILGRTMRVFELMDAPV